MREYVTNQGKRCSFKECGRPATNKRLCYSHYRQELRGNELSPLRAHKPQPVCSFEGCSLPHLAKSYCSGHLQQLRQGRELKPLGKRTLRQEDAMNRFGIKRARDVVLTDDEPEPFSPFKTAYEVIRNSNGEADLVNVIREIDQQYGSWELTKKLRDYFIGEMKRAPKDKANW